MGMLYLVAPSIFGTGLINNLTLFEKKKKKQSGFWSMLRGINEPVL